MSTQTKPSFCLFSIFFLLLFSSSDKQHYFSETVFFEKNPPNILALLPTKSFNGIFEFCFYVLKFFFYHKKFKLYYFYLKWYNVNNDLSITKLFTKHILFSGHYFRCRGIQLWRKQTNISPHVKFGEKKTKPMQHIMCQMG